MTSFFTSLDKDKDQLCWGGGSREHFWEEILGALELPQAGLVLTLCLFCHIPPSFIKEAAPSLFLDASTLPISTLCHSLPLPSMTASGFQLILLKSTCLE